MKRFLTYITLFAIFNALSLAQQDTTVIDRFSSHEIENLSTAVLVWENPAIYQFKHKLNLSTLSADFQYRNDNIPIEPTNGDKQHQWSINADTYIHHKSSTLWGNAQYRNGKTDNIKWNLTSEINTVGPYQLAANTTVNLKNELYGFSGGYADRKGKFTYGVHLSYYAGLYYSDTDPRPKNVTANLNAALGGAVLLKNNYLAGLSFIFEKYKQTNDVTFYSELGNDKLFHLTGLGNDYYRFAGTAYSTYYTGYKYGTALSFHPIDNSGFSTSVKYLHFDCDNILTTLNKLPLASKKSNSLQAEFAFLSGTWDLGSSLLILRNSGTENIFGDATASVYPKIGSLNMFHENIVQAGVSASLKFPLGFTTIALTPSVKYNHFNSIYREPKSRQLQNTLTSSLGLQILLKKRNFYGQFLIKGILNSPIDNELILAPCREELDGLRELILQNHKLTTNSNGKLSTQVSLIRNINKRYAIGASIDYSVSFFTDNTRRNAVTAAISFYF